MKGKDIRMAINHTEAIIRLLDYDYDDNIYDLSYFDNGKGFSYEDTKNCRTHDERIIMLIINHLIALSEILAEYKEKIDGMIEKIRTGNQVIDDIAGVIEDLTDEITCRIDDIDIPLI